MTRFGSLIVCATFGFSVLGCGGNGTSTKDPITLVPLSNTVSGWTVDPAGIKTPGERAKTATTKEATEALVDGGAAAFFMAPYTPKLFLWQDYINTSLAAAPPPDGALLMLYILEMPSEDQASGLYKDLLPVGDWARKAGTPDDWKPTTPTVGKESRIEDTGTQWWINFHQGVYYGEVNLAPSFGPAPDFTPGNAELKAEAIRFAQAVASQM